MSSNEDSDDEFQSADEDIEPHFKPKSNQTEDLKHFKAKNGIHFITLISGFIYWVFCRKRVKQ